MDKTSIIKVVNQDITTTALNKLTVQELRVAVRYMTNDVNERIKTMNSPQAQVAISKLKIAGLELGNRSRDTSSLSAQQKQESRQKVSANVNYKSKKELIKQLQGLQKFRKTDTESDKAREEYEQGFKEAYEKFKESEMGSKYKNLSSEEFKDLVNMMDKYKNVIDKSFKYDIFEAASTAKSQGKKVDTQAILNAFDQNKNESDVINALYTNLGASRK